MSFPCASLIIVVGCFMPCQFMLDVWCKIIMFICCCWFLLYVRCEIFMYILCGMCLSYMVINVVRFLCCPDGRILFVTMCEVFMLIGGLWWVRVPCNKTSHGENFPLMLRAFPCIKSQQCPCTSSPVTTLNEVTNTIKTLRPGDIVHTKRTPLLNVLCFCCVIVDMFSSIISA